MGNRFKEGYDTYNELLFRKIFNGGSLAEEVNLLRKTAKDYLNRVGIVKDAELMLAIEEAAFSMPNDEQGQQKTGLLIRELFDRYDVVHDELFIIAAFENFAKAELLNKRYLVHRIQRPNNLAKSQKKKPIHINTIKSKKYRDEIYLSHFTIGVEILLNNNYVSVLGLSDNEIESLEKSRRLRNSIHFGGPKFGYGLGNALFKGLAEFGRRFEN